MYPKLSVGVMILLAIGACDRRRLAGSRFVTVTAGNISSIPFGDIPIDSKEATVSKEPPGFFEHRAPNEPSKCHEWVKSAPEEEAIRLLRENSERLRCTDEHEWTALHWAARLGRPTIVQILLRHGADHNARSKRGRTPLHVLMDRLRRWVDSDSSPDELAMVRSAMTKGFEVSDQPLPPSYVDTTKALIEAGADVNAMDEISQSPIFWAVSGSHMEILEVLITHGARVDLRDVDGNSPVDLSKSDMVHRKVQARLEAELAKLQGG